MKKIIMEDGQVFDSITAFCEHYNVNRQKVYSWLRRGVKIEKLATLELRCTEVKDHKGQVYKSIKAMCDAYGLPQSTYCRRRNQGMTLEEILTLPRKKPKVDIVELTDGEYSTIKEFAMDNNLSYLSSCSILAAGGSIEDCLETTCRPPVLDHLGFHYDSIAAMCVDYGLSLSTYNNRRLAGFTLEEALTKPVKKYRKRKKRVA